MGTLFYRLGTLLHCLLSVLANSVLSKFHELATNEEDGDWQHSIALTPNPSSQGRWEPNQVLIPSPLEEG